MEGRTMLQVLKGAVQGFPGRNLFQSGDHRFGCLRNVFFFRQVNPSKAHGAKLEDIDIRRFFGLVGGDRRSQPDGPQRRRECRSLR